MWVHVDTWSAGGAGEMFYHRDSLSLSQSDDEILVHGVVAAVLAAAVDIDDADLNIIASWNKEGWCLEGESSFIEGI